MKKNEIVVGGKYSAKINGKLVTVRVDAIRESASYRAGRPNTPTTLYDVTNLTTSRKTTFRSAAKFRSEVQSKTLTLKNPPLHNPAENLADIIFGNAPIALRDEKQVGTILKLEDEKRPDPTSTAARTVVAGSTAPTNGLGALLATQLAAPKQADPPHLIIIARAGTGKTTTLLEGLKLLFQSDKCDLIPSDQQRAIWDSLRLSARPRYSCFAAFNTSIAAELAGRIPYGVGCAAKTLHGLGYYAIRQVFQLNRDPNDSRVPEIIGELMNQDLRVLRKERPLLLKATKQLVGLCKLTLTQLAQQAEGADGVEYNQSQMLPLVDHYGVELGEEKDRQQIFDLVPRVLERCKDVARDGYVDFDDMIWLPVVLNMKVFKNDILLVDEAQDLNRCQQAFAKMIGRRLVLCGDPRQAIYGFAGADADSMPRMERELADEASCYWPDTKHYGLHKFENGVCINELCNRSKPPVGRGVVVLPLTVTRRCGKAIVKEAQRLVPDIEAFPTNGEGEVLEASYPIQRVRTSQGWTTTELPYPETYLSMVRDGDMILCRANAPLVNQCFRFLTRGQKATIQGRDVADSLLELIDRIGGQSAADFLRNLHDWYKHEVDKENAQRNPSDNKIDALGDRRDCLICFVEQNPTAQQDSWTPITTSLKAKITEVFTDDGKTSGIRLSSIHRAKGLEADRVFYLQGFGRPMDKIKTQWERDQELNLRYVAITRAKHTLVYVSSERQQDRPGADGER